MRLRRAPCKNYRSTPYSRFDTVYIPMFDGEQPIGDLRWRGDEMGMEAIDASEAASALWCHYQAAREAIRRKRGVS
jgi:hypothetical protein